MAKENTTTKTSPRTSSSKQQATNPMVWVFLGLVLSAFIVAGAVFAALAFRQSDDVMTGDSVADLQASVKDLATKVDDLSKSGDSGSSAGAGGVTPAVTPTPSPTPSANAIGTNGFSVKNVEVGDTVAGYTVKSIQPRDPTKPLSDTNAEVVFSGNIEISGTYEYFDSTTPDLAGQVCMTEYSVESLDSVPILGESDSTFVCFTNTSLARSLFGPQGSTGQATVTVKDYTIVVIVDQGVEYWNDAVLVKATKQ